MRSFRNILVLATFMMIAATLLLALPKNAINSEWLPLCLATEASSAGSNSEDEANEEDTEEKGEATGSDCALGSVWKVELLGALGGLLAALTALQRLRGYRNPYNLPFVQALLKIPAGALTALVGLIFMQSGILFLEPVTDIKELVAYAILFAVAQELITRLIDQKAKSIVEAANPSSASGVEAGSG